MMAEHQLTCRTCGKQFTAATPKRGYCQQKCRPGHIAKMARKREKRAAEIVSGRREKLGSRIETVCIVCGKTFVPKEVGRTKCCSRVCGLAFCGMKAALSKNGGRVSVSILRSKCWGCGNRHDGFGPYCSALCKPPKPVVSYYSPIVAAKCRWCSSPFMRDDGRSTRYFCSEVCQSAAKRKAARPAKKKRRAIERGANGGESVSPDVVFARDAWRCCLCGKKTDPNKRGSTHPRAPELDHIIPVSKGGKHTYANTQCSCRECNGKKGAQVRGQLNLFPMG